MPPARTANSDSALPPERATTYTLPLLGTLLAVFVTAGLLEPNGGVLLQHTPEYLVSLLSHPQRSAAQELHNHEQRFLSS